MRYEHQLQENQKLAVIRVHVSTVALMEIGRTWKFEEQQQKGKSKL